VSALPHARSTSHKARAAPPQIGSSKIARMNFIHFGTRGILPQRHREPRGKNPN
jgi:hypothetical protein